MAHFHSLVLMNSKMALVFFIVSLLLQSTIEEDISSQCLNCICEAASGCEKDVGCLNDVCGPFKITFPYWFDANRPTVNDQEAEEYGAFENCANDMVCSRKTVRNYMRKYKKDCNDDVFITCYDYAAIHRLGPESCNEPLEDYYTLNITECEMSYLLQS